VAADLLQPAAHDTTAKTGGVGIAEHAGLRDMGASHGPTFQLRAQVPDDGLYLGQLRQEGRPRPV
jgi:hypothetical protein